MLWGELNNFTWGELKTLQWGDVALDKYELIAKAENGSVQLPDDVKEKLRALCVELDNRSAEKKTFFSKQKLETVGDVTKILSNIVAVVKGLNDLGLGLILKDCLDSIMEHLQ
ncbi:hypothetical protein [Hungatella sp. SL.1.14]|uniref:hypothetical protein n=1 Tax=Hungatella sp. SL.1.14 TaxID=2963703 RepID=UPI00210AA7CD|nr:hypothetical protein [Hungatella sp. SL.1.14]MCQ4832741.1 hypothetical protein [Hungatella sp. SL.1.14]